MLPPVFEPNGPVQEQWFPRPITDEIESPLDLLERMEEDRKRRLRAIARVPARTPIGLPSSSSGDPPAAPAGGGPTAAGPPPGHPAAAVGNANYGRYRYYPPPARDSGDGDANAALLHQTYSLDRLSSSPSPAVTGRSGERQEQRRRVRAARRPNPRRSGESRTSIDTGASLSSAADSSADRGFVNDASYRSGGGGRASISPVRSPAFDPRAGGGGGASRRSLGGAASRLSFGGASVGSSCRYPRLSVDTSAAAETTMTAREFSTGDYVTPTARSTFVSGDASAI